MHAVPYLTVPAAADHGSGGPISLVMSLASRPDYWRGLVDYRSDTRWYRLVERHSGYEVWLLSWLPGQGTPLHDHGAATGAFAVASGALTERVLAPRPGRPAVEVTRRLEVGRVRAFGPHYVHQVHNAGTEPAVSLHVYTPRLTVMNRYELDLGRLNKVAEEQAGVDW